MTCSVAVRNCFPRGEVTNMFFHYFESSNEVSIGRDGREGEMRGGELWNTYRWIFGAVRWGY